MKGAIKTFYKLIIGLFLVSLWIGLASCKKESAKPPEKPKASQHPIILPETAPLNPEKLKAPAGLKVKKTAMQHTAQIGTPEQPTLDGGIINAADGIPVMPAEEKPASPVKSVAKKPENLNQTPLKAKTPKLDDKWATSPQISQILNRAIKEGKLTPILKEADSLGLPAGAALLPMVESRYQEHALSPKGAAGMWQLMPGLARDYGLTYQQRFDTYASTPVALTYLKSLYQQFGNWALAYAAYNAGPARVSRALKENSHAQTIDELNLPLETKNYVHRMQQIHTTLLFNNPSIGVNNP